MKKYLFCIVILLISIIVFCFGFVNMESKRTSNNTQEDTITYGIEQIPNDLEKVTKLSKRDEDIICALSKGLVSKDVNNNINPSLASEVIKDKEGIGYEFKIRDDIFWSDGSKITSKDIVTFFKELLKEEDEENIQALLNVYGAKEFKEGKNIFETGVAIRESENTVIFRLNKKDDNFLEELSKPQYRLRKNLIMWRNMINNYKKLAYSGDYRLEAITQNNLVLKKNYRSSEAVVSNINILNDDNVEMSMAAYEVNERDIVINPPESEINKLAEQKKIITIPETKATYLAINDRNNSIPIQGRREIYNNVYKALELYQNSNSKEFELAEGSFFREDKQDLTKLQARKVISNKEEEWKRPQVLTILCEDTNENRNLCRIIQEWFKRNTSITIKYSAVKEEFGDEELIKRYDMVLINSEASKKNKLDFYSNIKKYFTDTQNGLLEKCYLTRAEVDYLNLEENLFVNYKILPLVFYNENIAISDKISKLKLDGNGNIDFSTVQ